MLYKVFFAERYKGIIRRVPDKYVKNLKLNTDRQPPTAYRRNSIGTSTICFHIFGSTNIPSNHNATEERAI